MRGIVEFLRHSFGAPGIGGPAKRGEPTKATPTAATCKVEFDAAGKVLSVKAPPPKWASMQEGQNRYYTHKGHSLLEAAEVLKAIDTIPAFAYYTVNTADGPLGRDIQGLFTEAPLKTQDLVLETSGDPSQTVEFLSLKGFGDMMRNQTSVAMLKKQGSYARLVLLMKCGRCGYESPVETQPGAMVRQCYCCGAQNKGQRGNVNVVLDTGVVKI